MKSLHLQFLFSLLIFVAACTSPDTPKSSYEFPFQDPVLDIEERVTDLVSRLTIEEKAEQLFNEAPAIERLDIPKYNWWNECLHGVARAGKATVFPQAIGLAATFDEDLMFRIATAISDEGRAKHHDFTRNNARSIYMGLTFWTPNINIFRDPRWGRGQETYGEDPYLTGRMAVNFVNGLQGDHPKYFKSIATIKHYAVHSGPEFTRHTDNLFVNDRDLYTTYLPAFEMAIKEANVQSVMCAYNRFRDQPCCGSDLLLTNILRNEFGFAGYVVTDCGAVTDFYRKGHHHVVETPAQAWGWTLSTGSDLNCEESRAFLPGIDSALSVGIINEKDMNTSLSRLFKARFQLGMFDPEDMNPYANIPMSVVGSEEHLNLSLEAAEKSLVLLKNDGILPLDKSKKIALIGPNANNFAILIGNYNGVPIEPVTPLEAFQKSIGEENISYTPGCPLVSGIYSDYIMVGAENFFHADNGERKPGLKAKYYLSTDFTGDPSIERVDEAIDFFWERSPINQVADEPFSVSWEGLLVPGKSGTFIFRSNGQVKIDGIPYSGKSVKLRAGKEYKIEVKLVVNAFWWRSNHQQAFANLYWFDVSRDLRKEAMAAAESAEVIIFCGGISPHLEGEEMSLETDGFAHGDRTHLQLPKVQLDLLKELHKTGKQIVYVNFSGSAIALNWQEKNVSAIIQGFYPGEATGTALTNLIYGDMNPSGRLPITFYKSVEDLPDFLNYQMKGRTYRYFEGESLYEFGYGLSYTNFQYSKIVVSNNVSRNKEFTVSVSVTNTGARDGNEVVQLYLKDVKASVPVPLRSLAGIKNINIKAGETQTVDFPISPDQLKIIDANYIKSHEAGEFIISVGGRQPSTEAIEGQLVVEASLIVQ